MNTPTNPTPETGPEPEGAPEHRPAEANADAAPGDQPEPAVGLSIDDMLTDVAWGDYEHTLGRWKQGHLVRDIPLAWSTVSGADPFTGMESGYGEEGPMWPEGAFDAVICSQTCDLGGGPPGDQHPTILVAPLVHESGLGSSSRKSLAAAGRLSYFVQTLPADPGAVEELFSAHAEAVKKRAERVLEQTGEGGADDARWTAEGEPKPVLTGVRDSPRGHRWYADLRLLVPVSKGLLLSRDPIDGFVTEAESLAFGEILAQKFRRPALHEALSEELPAALEEFVRNVGANKQAMAKVEQVRLHILEGDRLNPRRAQLLVLTCGGALSGDERDVWDGFNKDAAKVCSGHGFAYRPIVHYDVDTMLAAVYRNAAPMRCRLLGHTRWP